MRPSLATDRISLGFWLNIRFVVDYRGAVRSIVAIAIDLLTSEVRYILWITAVPLPRWCLQSRQHSGSRMRGVTLALSGPPNLRPESDHRYFILLLFHQPISSPNCIYLQSDLSCLYKLNCNRFIHHTTLYFSLHRPSPTIRHFGHFCRKTCLATVLIRSIFAREKLHERFSASAVFQRKIERINTVFYHDVGEIWWPQPIRLLKMGHVTGQGSTTMTWVGRVSDLGKSSFHKMCKKK